MEHVKCSECGSSNILRDNWLFVCENCNAKFSLDSTGKESKKLDDLIAAGLTSYNNGDYRNAATFFKSALDINPNNGFVFHYYNMSSDFDYLNRAGHKSVPALASALKGKIGSIFDMYHRISETSIRNQYLHNAINDFDKLCNRIREVAHESGHLSEKNYNYIVEAYQYGINKLKDNEESLDIVTILSNRLSEYKKADYDNDDMDIELNDNGTSSNFEIESSENVNANSKVLARISIICLLLCIVCLFLTVISIRDGWELSKIIGLVCGTVTFGIISVGVLHI